MAPYLWNYSPFTSLLLLFRPKAFPSGLSRPRHPGWNVIARAVFPFLFLEYRIIHMDVVEYGGQVLMSQELLERKGIVAFDEVVHGKGVPENVRTDTFVGDPRACSEPLEEHFHPVFGERLAGLREKQVIFSSTTPFCEFF